jgi:hypothetical protein
VKLAANSILRASGSRVNSTSNRHDDGFNGIKAGTRLYAQRLWPQKGRLYIGKKTLNCILKSSKTQ